MFTNVTFSLKIYDNKCFSLEMISNVFINFYSCENFTLRLVYYTFASFSGIPFELRLSSRLVEYQYSWDSLLVLLFPNITSVVCFTIFIIINFYIISGAGDCGGLPLNDF